jgi:putative ABC transport system ATP-binding protein
VDEHATAPLDASADDLRDDDLVAVLEDVVKEYAGPPRVRALDHASLKIRSRELVAIAGPSGSGKTTLLQIMGTLDRPTSGRVTIAGYDVDLLSDRELSALRAQRIGFVFQQFFLLERETALENVANGLIYRGINTRERRKLAATALERVGLAHRLQHRASQLSGGERQRVAVARAVVGRPSIVLADEPTGNLDTRRAEEIIELLEHLNRDGVTIVVITHSAEVAERLPRLVRIRDGRIVEDSGDAADITAVMPPAGGDV